VRRLSAYLAVMFTMVLALAERLLEDCPPLDPLELDELAAEMAQGECWPALLPPPFPPPDEPLEPAAGELGLFFHGWKPLPTAASAKGGGDLFESLLHWAANMARGVPLKLGWSCNEKKGQESRIKIKILAFSAVLLNFNKN